MYCVQSTSKLYMADLAGSERISRSKVLVTCRGALRRAFGWIQVSGDGLQEALAINSSLTALGKFIEV